ncbi:MAG TPA: ferrochelatase [Pseudomonadales bacterium]|nr:ferrochelatase [Pseudomonadales bacterium]
MILVNLGSPPAPEPVAVRKFLDQFLSDPRVVEIPRLLWLPLLKGIILPLRCRRVAKLYKEIWTENGSPLTAMTYRQAALLEDALHRAGQEDVVVRVAMTYGEPAIADLVVELGAQGVGKFLVLPLYPQYSGTTTGAIYDQLARLTVVSRYVPDVQVVRDYCHREDYIFALAKSIRDHRAQYGSAELLLFSFHGIPQACIDKGDPYYEHCVYTADTVAEVLGLTQSEWKLCFQSRFGRAKWLQPYTDEVLISLPATGISRVDIICPAFASDCLETLEEIEIGSRNCFIGAGGKYFSRIPCLNDSSDHIKMLQSIVAQYGF